MGVLPLGEFSRQDNSASGIEAMADFPYTGHHIKSGDMNTFYLMYLMPNLLWWFAALVSVWLCGSVIGKALARPVVIVNKKKQ